ncbi:MAG: cell division protein FtsA [Brevinemataceae bacterium]
MSSKSFNQPNDRIIAGLDMGTGKIAVVISGLDMHNKPEILGVASVPSRGIRKGVVINLEQAAFAAISAIEKAELQAGTTVNSVMLGISGGHIEITKSKAVIAVPTGREINKEDINRVIDAATTVVIPPDREIIHVLPQEFSVDDQKGIKDPIGMLGSRLEVYVHIITVAAASVNNLIKSVYKAGFDTSDIILKSLASSRALIHEEERDEGCLLIDIGAGTTDFIVFLDGGMRHTGQLSIGGSHITNDISYGMKVTMHTAEKIKCQYGSAIAAAVPLQEQFEILNPNGRSERLETRRLLAEIIQPRLEEILFLVNEEIEKTRFKSYLSAGIILTGGVACTENIEELAMEIFNLPVRVGSPINLRGLNEFVRNPSLSTAVGLSLYGLQHKPQIGSMSSPDEDKNFQNIVQRIQGWFNEFF